MKSVTHNTSSYQFYSPLYVSAQTANNHRACYQRWYRQNYMLHMKEISAFTWLCLEAVIKNLH